MKTIAPVQHTEAKHHLSGHIGAWQDWNLTECGRVTADYVNHFID